MYSGLSYNEKLILYGLVKFPDKSDNEISNILNVKKSTLSTIKKKLSQKNYFCSIRVPIFQNIGCELLIVTYAKFNQKTTLQERLNISKELWFGTPEHFYIISESNQSIIFSISKNITDFEESYEEITQLYNKYKFFEGQGFTTIFFPLKLSKIFQFFDFAPFLNRFFKLNFKDTNAKINEVSRSHLNDKKSQDMTKLEKRIFYELIRNPDFSDYKIAEIIKCSRQTVSRMKRKFYKSELIQNIRIINLKKLGLGILCFTHSKFNPKTTLEERKEYIKKIEDIKTPIINISRRSEGIMLTPFCNYTEYQDIHGKITRFSARKKFLKEDPFTMLLSIPRMFVLKEHEHAILVKKILGL